MADADEIKEPEEQGKPEKPEKQEDTKSEGGEKKSFVARFLPKIIIVVVVVVFAGAGFTLGRLFGGSSASQILEHYRITWGGGYKKERIPHRWKNLGILLLGGCTKMPFIRKKLSWYNPGQDFCPIEPDVRVVELPGDIQIIGSQGGLCLRDYANLLTVAHGASFHIGEIMSFFKPRDVNDYKPPPPPEIEGPFFGHWW